MRTTIRCGRLETTVHKVIASRFKLRNGQELPMNKFREVVRASSDYELKMLDLLEKAMESVSQN